MIRERIIKISDLELFHKIQRVESCLNMLMRVVEKTDSNAPHKKITLIEAANEHIKYLKQIIDDADSAESGEHERKLS